ncbi:BPSS1780 family membrane protein [Pseudomonadota bacterium]
MPDNTVDHSRASSFSRGLAWLVQSLALLRMQSGRLLLIAVFMQVILGLTQLRLIWMLIIISVPALSAGVLEAFDVTSRGGRPGLNLLFKPLTSGTHRGRLLLMGLLVFAVGILSISLMLSGSEVFLDPEMVSRIEQRDIDALTELDQGSLGKMIMAFLVGITISGTLSYFTIPLIWFGDRKLGQALVEGIKALVVHWKPFLTLALGLFLISIPVIVVSTFLIGMAASGGLISGIVMACMMILLLAFQMLLFASQYCAFRDIFGIGERSGPPTEEDDSQLVA